MDGHSPFSRASGPKHKLSSRIYKIARIETNGIVTARRQFTALFIR